MTDDLSNKEFYKLQVITKQFSLSITRPSLYHFQPIPAYKDDFENECSTGTFYPDTIMTYKIDVTTFRNMVVSPVTYRTAVPSGDMHLFEFVSAEVDFRGRNVGCVNPGKLKSKVVEW